jgi:inner membrane protein
MDSLTQIALGAAVGVAVMGRRTAVWKAALWGGVAGTLPDLDAFVDHGDAILNMTRHRAETHAPLILSLVAPLMAWAVAALHDERALFRRWWLALWLALVTHPLLDTMTVYGTQLLQPFSSHPYGVGSIFIIDPLYTLPLIVGVVAALRLKSVRGQRWNLAGLCLSSLYLVWSVAAQQHVTQQAQAALRSEGVVADQLLVTPTPFNTVLWRLVATTPTHYLEGYRSLLDARNAPITWTRHERGAGLIQQHAGDPYIAHMAAFTHGLYSVSQDPENDHLYVTDLRMGQEPAYFFRFDLGTASARANGDHRPLQAGSRPDPSTTLPWLWRRLWGQPLRPPLEP